VTAVSFIVPVRNAGPSLVRTVEAIAGEADGLRSWELILVDDRSTDEALAKIRSAFPDAPTVFIDGDGRGACAALNLGLKAARYPLIAQVDQDVVLQKGWLGHLIGRIAPAVAAVQGQYVCDPAAPLLARLMSLDLQDRYARLADETEHACTGNVLYQAAAVHRVGGFDEAMGYGYDNDMSYRLRAAGYTLRYCAGAKSTHRWREGLAGYVRQQYGFGYGRLDLVAKHRRHLAGDSVSPAMMMMHPVLLAVALACFAVAPLAGDWPAASVARCGWAIVGALVLERTVAGARAAVRFRDRAPLLFPVVHLVRDLAWIAAAFVWLMRRLAGLELNPRHSMRPRMPIGERQ
jgi:cellulose synthase/poly-beta-1,6-N-acetylglucosamine synthase-like glycosyltransferase